MAVILEVPFVFTASAIVKRYPNDPKRVPMVECIPVKVPEVDAERAPLVMRAMDPVGRVVDYRAMNGALMRSLTLSQEAGSRAVRSATAQAVFDRFTGLAQARHGAVYWPFVPEIYPVPRHQDYEVRRVVESDRADRVQATREAFEYGSAFVDGRLFAPSRGPAWVLAQPDDYRLVLRKERGHVAQSTIMHLRDFQPFAPEQLAEAEASVAAHLARASRGTYGGPHLTLGRTRGMLLTQDDLAAGATLRPAIAALAADTLLHKACPFVGKLPPDAIRAYADLTTLLAEAREIPEERMATALRAMGELRDGLGGIDQRLIPATLHEGSRERAALVKRLLDGRPIPGFNAPAEPGAPEASAAPPP